jgi:hypothetical protein
MSDDDLPITVTVIYGEKKFDARAAYLDALLDADVRRYNELMLSSPFNLKPVTRRSIIPQSRSCNVVQFRRRP